jgi:hypothetical protein
MTSEIETVCLAEEEIMRLDALAAARGLTREEALAGILRSGLLAEEARGGQASPSRGEETS